VCLDPGKPENGEGEVLKKNSGKKRGRAEKTQTLIGGLSTGKDEGKEETIWE